MYKHEYQGGPTVEILSCQGKDPLQKWKISNSSGNGTAGLAYEKNVKGYAVQLEGSTVTSKMQLPKTSKKPLHLTQKYLVLQVYVPAAKDFSIELAMTDTTGSKRRVLMSTSAREISITPLHAKLNISLVKRDTWLNLCIDLSSFISDVFLKQTFKCLDLIVIAGNCKVRKIFTMRNQPPDTTGLDFDAMDSYDAKQPYFQLENVPPNVQFSSSVMYMTQVINVNKIRSEIIRVSKQRSGSVTSRSDKESENLRYTHEHHSHSRDTTKSISSNQRNDKKSKRPTSSGSEKTAVSIPSQKAALESKSLKSASNGDAPILSTRSPFSLIQLVDDMEIRDSLESGSSDWKSTSSDTNDVFVFSSKPHVAHERPSSATNRAMQRNSSLHEDMNCDGENELSDAKPLKSKELKESKSLPVLANGNIGGLSLRDSEITLMSSAETLIQTSERNPTESNVEAKSAKHDESSTSTPLNVTISRKTIREIPPKSDTSLLSNVGESFTNLPVDSWSESFEGRFLSEMKREQEEEDFEEQVKQNNVVDNDIDYNEDSFDASWSTWKQPPGMDSEAYAMEMKGGLSHGNMQTLDLTLDRTRYEDSGNLPSPPIILASERSRYPNSDDYLSSEVFGVSDGSTVSGQSTSLNESDDEEMLDLMYDPCLNCYFDPKSGRYYELKG